MKAQCRRSSCGFMRFAMSRYTCRQRRAVAEPMNQLKSTQRKSSRASRAAPPPVIFDEDPLLRILVAKATSRGQPLKSLAQELGVSYGRLAQWRREKAAMRIAHRSVHARAARYLGIPTVLALVLAGVVGIEDFVLPGPESLDERLRKQFEEMRHDPFFAAFVPPCLVSAAPEVRLFVAFLYGQARGISSTPQQGMPWVTDLHRAVVALRALQTDVSDGVGKGGIF